MDLSHLDWLIGIIPGLALGVFGTKIFFKPKESKRIAGSADNKIKVENEVLTDRIKQLESKIQTLEKALEIATK